jgi:hypothetical protein
LISDQNDDIMSMLGGTLHHFGELFPFEDHPVPAGWSFFFFVLGVLGVLGVSISYNLLFL